MYVITNSPANMVIGKEKRPYAKRLDRLLFVVLMVLILGIFAFRLFQFWAYTVDDAYITLRFAYNLVAGYGLVYNPGGPVVEGYSNPLLLLFQCVVLLLNGDGIFWTKVLGSLAGLAALAGSIVLARDLLRWAEEEAARVSRLTMLAGAFVFASSPALATGCVSGLETSLFTALLTWGMWGFLRVLQGEGENRDAVLAGLCMGLATWTRPEGIVWAAALGGIVIVLRGRRRQSLRNSLLASSLAVGFWLVLLIFRLLVFGHPHPNTYYAKMGGNQALRFLHGLYYLRDWAVIGWGYVLLFLAVAGAFLQPSARRRPALVGLLLIFIHIIIVAYEGGDWMPHLRLLTPMLGVLAGLTSLGLGLIVGRIASRHIWWASVIAVVIFSALMFLLAKTERLRAFKEVQTRVYGWNDAHRPLGQWLGQWRESRGGQLRVAIEDIGLVGWYSGAHIDDLAGMVDPEWAHFYYDCGRTARYPTRQLLVGKRPEVVVLVATARPRQGRLVITWRKNRDIYEDPEFLQLYRHLTVFTHKDFPNDGYYLHVFLRKDVYGEAPPVTPPVPRARGGWD